MSWWFVPLQCDSRSWGRTARSRRRYRARRSTRAPPAERRRHRRRRRPSRGARARAGAAGAGVPDPAAAHRPEADADAVVERAGVVVTAARDSRRRERVDQAAIRRRVPPACERQRSKPRALQTLRRGARRDAARYFPISRWYSSVLLGELGLAQLRVSLASSPYNSAICFGFGLHRMALFSEDAQRRGARCASGRARTGGALRVEGRHEHRHLADLRASSTARAQELSQEQTPDATVVLIEERKAPQRGLARLWCLCSCARGRTGLARARPCEGRCFEAALEVMAPGAVVLHDSTRSPPSSGRSIRRARCDHL